MSLDGFPLENTKKGHEMLHIVLFSVIMSATTAANHSRYPAFVAEVSKAKAMVQKADANLVIEKGVDKSREGTFGWVCIKDRLLPNLSCVYQYSTTLTRGKTELVGTSLIEFTYKRVENRQWGKFGRCAEVMARRMQNGKRRRVDQIVCRTHPEVVMPVSYLDKEEP